MKTFSVDLILLECESIVDGLVEINRDVCEVFQHSFVLILQMRRVYFYAGNQNEKIEGTKGEDRIIKGVKCLAGDGAGERGNN